jgi:hypothetical protein
MIVQSVPIHACEVLAGPLTHPYRKKTPVFLSFPYVCPEPVLAKRSFSIAQNWRKTGVSLPNSHQVDQRLRSCWTRPDESNKIVGADQPGALTAGGSAGDELRNLHGNSTRLKADIASFSFASITIDVMRKQWMVVAHRHGALFARGLRRSTLACGHPYSGSRGVQLCARGGRWRSGDAALLCMLAQSPPRPR